MALINHEGLKATQNEGDDVRKALVRLLRTLNPIHDHAQWSMDYCRKSPASHQAMIEDDRDDMKAFKDAVSNAFTVLFPPDDDQRQTDTEAH